jgi:hypothetical protein
MSKQRKVSLVVAVAAGLAVGLTAGGMFLGRAEAQRGEGGTSGGPRYTVVETQGHNLIVTDNRTNAVYYYTTDRDSEPGSDLHLRGKVDLSQVGQKTIKPACYFKKHKE